MSKIKIAKKAFTLIELLVIIAIMGILASVILVSLGEAKKRSRDTTRMSDLKQIVTAIELHHSSFGSYPLCGNNVLIDGTTDCLSVTLKNAGISNLLPSDPIRKGASGGYQYYNSGDGKQFGLRAGLETKKLTKTHNYPNGTSCFTSGLPTCPWYGQNYSESYCVYEGYNSFVSCGQSIHYGNTQR